MARAHVALGSNLDEPERQVRQALLALAQLPLTQVESASRLFRTPPWGLPAQPWYVNAVAELRTDLSPEALMQALLGLEQRLGRSRDGERWGPRRIDLDLLLYDRLTVSSEGLELPHPRLAERAFVVLPLLDIAPDLVLPDGRPLRHLREQLDTSGIEPLP